MRVGIEVGGTFTDLIAVEDGAVRVTKVPSTPASPDRGAVDAVEKAGIALGDVRELVHGSTVATNAVLERKGARVGVFVTRGMRDLFTLQRHDRRRIYDLHYAKPEPVVRRADVAEIDGRMAPDGSVVDDIAGLDETVRSHLAKGFDAVAICLLHSYVNPAHEREVAAAVHALAPDMPITCSVDVSPEFREYERASTTAMAAYVRPVIEGYLGRLTATLEASGFAGHFSLMQSNGGRMPARAMAENAITALFSGPAAGVVGAMGAAARSGFDSIITLDMGGTSTDVSLVADGLPDLAPMTKIDGLPVRTPVIDIATVGAGGGSIAWRDDGGLLRAGPQSAGADPGPAAYGKGGPDPTVTDAHLIRGTLQPDLFLGGEMDVDLAASRAVFAPLARAMNLTPEALADSVIRVAEGNIVRAIQQVSTERGHDPRDFVLVPFGGAGPLHAARVAEDLGIRTVVVPVNAGVLSAAGLLMSDYSHYRARTERVRLNAEAIPRMAEVFAELTADAEAYLADAGVSGPFRHQHLLEMRYVGQAFEVTVALDHAPEEMTLEALQQAFADAHHRIFEFSKPPEEAAEIVSYRLGIHAAAEPVPVSPTGASPDPGRTVEITEGGITLNCAVRPRSAVTGAAPGPLLIEDGTSTIYVPPGWTVRRDTADSLILEVAS
ncbi:MAG: hydantoinase/oxoprolinase family protein [Pseudomonadota bacterium]